MTEVDEALKEETSPEMQLLGQKRGNLQLRWHWGDVLLCGLYRSKQLAIRTIKKSSEPD